MKELLVAKHAKFFQRVLVMVPEEHAEEHLAVVYFSYLGLALLRQLSQADAEAALAYVRDLARPDGAGFRMGSLHTANEPINVTATYFALSILRMAGYSWHDAGVDREATINIILACQLASGAVAVSPGNSRELSARFAYCAVASLRMLDYDFEDKTSTTTFRTTIQWLHSLRDPMSGGYGDSQTSPESHAGFTFCVAAALELLGEPLQVDDDLIKFLSHRQAASGGFNGRINKKSDACYSFWNLGACNVLGLNWLPDITLARKFLLETSQNDMLGGFVKEAGGRPDPLHSALALAALSLASQPELAPLDVLLTTTIGS